MVKIEKTKNFIIEAINIYLGKTDKQVLISLYKHINYKSLKNLVAQYNIDGILFDMYLKEVFNGLKMSPDFINFLKRTAQKNSLINSLYKNEVLKIVKKLDENDIVYFYMKGEATRKRCFENDYATKSTDIDFFVKHKDYRKIKEILISLNYKIPFDYYKKIINYTTFNIYEKNEGEICFIKKEGFFEYIVDLHWDLINHDRTGVFHNLYDLKNFYNFNKKSTIMIDLKKINVFPLELEFINMSFHYAFHHGFNGLRWFIELCLFLKKYENKIDFNHILKNANFNLKKILGIILMLVYNFIYDKKLSKEQKKQFCVAGMLPCELSVFKNSITKILNLKRGSKNLRLIKLLLPYYKREGFRIIKENIYFNFKNYKLCKSRQIDNLDSEYNK